MIGQKWRQKSSLAIMNLWIGKLKESQKYTTGLATPVKKVSSPKRLVDLFPIIILSTTRIDATIIVLGNALAMNRDVWLSSFLNLNPV